MGFYENLYLDEKLNDSCIQIHFYVSINCYSLFTNSRQRLKYSRDFFWTKWRRACYVIIILPSPKQKLYWVEFQRRFEVLLWSCWTNFEIKRSKCIVFLFYWVVLFIRHYFLKISFFHLTSPLIYANFKALKKHKKTALILGAEIEKRKQGFKYLHLEHNANNEQQMFPFKKINTC